MESVVINFIIATDHSEQDLASKIYKFIFRYYRTNDFILKHDYKNMLKTDIDNKHGIIALYILEIDSILKLNSIGIYSYHDEIPLIKRKEFLSWKFNLPLRLYYLMIEIKDPNIMEDIIQWYLDNLGNQISIREMEEILEISELCMNIHIYNRSLGEIFERIPSELLYKLTKLIKRTYIDDCKIKMKKSMLELNNIIM